MPNLADNNKNKNANSVPLTRGCSIVQQFHRLKESVETVGTQGWVRIVQALIITGVKDREQILEQGCSIVGHHLREELALLLIEGIDVHWFEDEAGHLYL